MATGIGPVTRAVHDKLVDAIDEWQRIRFRHDNRERYAEPQCYGLGRHGEPQLRVYQLGTGSVDEPLFRVDRIENVELVDEYFDSPGPSYKMDDSAMAVIFAQLDPEHPPFRRASRPTQEHPGRNSRFDPP